MKKNVIILTHGWTGSSAFTALIARAGYWPGDSTVEKVDYDTFENTELVTLNKQLLNEMGYQGDRDHDLMTETLVSELADRATSLDLQQYQSFIERLNQHQPWIWKDPRLTLTIRIWARLLDLDNIAFIILTRDDEQSWITSNQRRHIQSRNFTRKYNQGVTSTLRHFLQTHQQDFLEFQFEDLQLRPEATLSRLNEFLEISLSMDDLKAVYHKPLYEKSKGFKDKLEAFAIYLKNYRMRDGRQAC
ncbi:sulfotransferase [Photobacterium sp. 1_MG-2023]|uniref:sulfotransferase n=1 Tax=Photobacterium sp. 1_MG-2023 TaxID=3062646 RepID=UPI0026E485DD|nr:sulfotransferase [Photobacterium sp. 1_MG-2023]MDO6706451.1 sulfotransferase [Photobacterium sp. 1_MG-2023]